MTIYFTRLITASNETLLSLREAIPSLRTTTRDAWTFEHDSDNEQEVAHWFRGIMLSASDGGARWITPVSLEKEQNWMTGETAELFRKVREDYGL